MIPPPLIQTFSIPEINATVKDSPTEIFGTEKKISTEKLDTPPPLLFINFLATGNFLKHSTEGFPYEIFRHCETKNFRRKNLDTPPSPPIHKLFRYRKFSETQDRRVHLRNFSAMWDQKITTENLDTPLLPLLIHKLFRCRKISETQHRRVHLQIFSALWDKNFSTENRDTPPPPPHSSINFFATGKFLKHSTEGFLYEIFRYCKTKNFRRKIVTYPSEA